MHPNAIELKKRVLSKLKETMYLSNKHSSDVEIALFLELDGFLENFSDTYHLN